MPVGSASVLQQVVTGGGTVEGHFRVVVMRRL
jgi:hypothetical protein